MIYAVISDIHANESALRKVLDDAKAHGAQHIICLGDVVGYGPLPSETLNLLLSQNATIIAGNHDDAVSGRVDEDNFIDLARDAVLRHREMLPPKSRDILSSLPYTIAFGEAVASHGDFTEPEKFNYIESEEDAAINFSSINSRLTFVGHTHVPGIYLTGQSGAVYKIDPQDFTVEDGKRYIVNPGSVGYPREKDGKCFSSYVLYDSDERTVTFRFIPFAVSSVMQRGENPKRIKKRILILASAALSLTTALLAWFCIPKEEVLITQVVAEDESALKVDERILVISPEKRHFKVNLQLDFRGGSAPANVHVAFIDADGNTMTEKVETVKSSWSKKEVIGEDIRKSAKQIKITVKKQKPEEEIKIVKFEPIVF
jgi:predicted phosphodiesterase